MLAAAGIVRPATAVLAVLGLDWVTDQVSDAWWTYPLITAVTAFDAVLPILPSETMIITAAVVAAKGGLSVILIVAAAALGAFLGDTMSYWLGRKVGDPAARRLFKGEKSRERLEWARRTIHEHGPVMVLAGRFVPGGRTAVTFASGTVNWEYRRFATADAPAALVWGIYVTMLGYLFGSAFQEKVWLAILLSLAIAALVAGAGEVTRRVRSGDRGRDGDKDAHED